jgi:two-component system, OmpR family, catabolic regulation response regulator CreB
MQILLIEDEHSIALPLTIALTAEGFTLTHCELARDGLEVLRSHPIDLLILDIGLPDMNGLHALKILREFSQVPVLLLTARAEEADKIFGLELGADDYVTKPFSPKEVIARIKAIVKRTQNKSAPLETSAPLIINNQTLRVTLYGQILALTPAELRILTTLAQAPGAVCSRDQLLNILGQACAVYERNIDTHIKTLRAKCRLCCSEDIIKTHRGFGYSLALKAQICP